jgi:hypothetical protein
MKKIKYIIIIISLSITSCLKEDYIADPSIKSVSMFMPDVNGRDSLVSEVLRGSAMTIKVETEAEICSVWPGGVRNIMKKKGTAIDSLDMFNHPVLINSDCYSDYGLVGARGFKGTQTDGGWYIAYKYPAAGEYDLTVVLTNHGYQGTDYKQVVIEFGKVNVR